MRLRHGAWLSLTLVLLTSNVVPRAEKSPVLPPSVLLITLDTTRADKLGCYGNREALTPFLDTFASRAQLFERCYAPAPQTEPSHVSIFSGWNPARHGVRKNLDVQLAPDVPLLAEAFRDAGYATGAFVSSYVLLGHFGLGRGYQKYDGSFYDLRRPETSTERKAQDTLAAARRWIEQQKKPWFCWIHLYDPHSPYAPPEPFAERYKNAPYDGEIAYMDSSLGVFFHSLEKLDALKETIVVICGDHGESLGEHGEAEHGVFLYDATTRVPLIIRQPGVSTKDRISACVGLVDLAPTVRELCGLSPALSDGVSLVPLLDGKPFRSRPVLIESLIPLLDYGWAPLYAAVDGNFKFILAPRPELYNLAIDPKEENNIFRGNSAMVARLEEMVKGYIGSTRAVSRQKTSLGEEEMRSLRSLGYISGGAEPSSNKSYRDPKDCLGILKDVYDSVAFSKAGDSDKASLLLESALRADPSNATVACLLGQSYELKDAEKAEVAYRTAIKLRPDYPQPYLRLVALLFKEGKSKESYETAQVALRYCQDYSGMLHVLLAWDAFRIGRPEREVAKLLDQAIALAPERPLSYKLKAVLCIKKGDNNGAISFLEKMASCAPPFLMKALETDEDFKPMREDQRFWQLVLGGHLSGGKE